MKTFFDVVRTAKDETSAYVTTTPLHDPRHTPPGVVVIVDESLTPEEAVDMLRGSGRPASSSPRPPRTSAPWPPRPTSGRWPTS